MKNSVLTTDGQTDGRTGTAQVHVLSCAPQLKILENSMFVLTKHCTQQQSRRHPRTFFCSDYKLYKNYKNCKVHNQNADLIFNTRISQSLITSLYLSKFSSFRNKNFVRKVSQMPALNIFI